MGAVAGVVGIEGGVVSGDGNLELSGVGASDWIRRHAKHYRQVRLPRSRTVNNARRLVDDWFDPIEAGVRDRVREFIQAMIEGELDAAIMRPRYGLASTVVER